MVSGVEQPVEQLLQCTFEKQRECQEMGVGFYSETEAVF